MTELIAISNDQSPPVRGAINPVWKRPKSPRHEFEVAICPDEDGGCSVFAVQYPGVISQGDTVEEAKANIKEAFIAMLDACRDREQDMEFADTIEVPANHQKVWITIDG